tara:strand:- start:306 stop:530 length:225 start_codon:yes stop_codon:yes gene_type:complete
MKIFIYRVPMLLMIVITSILVILKLNDNIGWSWDDVFLPLQLFVILGIFFALVHVFIDIKEKKSKKINNKQEFY